MAIFPQVRISRVLYYSLTLSSAGSALVSANIKTDTLAGYINATKIRVVNHAKAILTGMS